MSTHRLAHRAPGQVLPVLAVLIVTTVTVVVFVFNTVVVSGNALRIMEGAARSAGFAAVHRVDPAAAYARWDIDEPAAEARAREIVRLALAGDPVVSGANAAGLFAGSLTTALARGTSGGTQDGLDVEIIVPAPDLSMSSTRTLNGAAAATSIANPSAYPQGVASAITGGTYDRPTVILRLRLTAVQFGAPDRALEVVVATAVGTDG